MKFRIVKKCSGKSLRGFESLVLKQNTPNASIPGVVEPRKLITKGKRSQLRKSRSLVPAPCTITELAEARMNFAQNLRYLLDPYFSWRVSL